MQRQITALENEKKKIQDELSSIDLRIGGLESALNNTEQQARTETNQEVKRELLMQLEDNQMQLEKTYMKQQMLKKQHAYTSCKMEDLAERKKEIERVLKTLQDEVSSLQLSAGSITVEIEELEKKVNTENDAKIRTRYEWELMDRKEQYERYSYMVKEMQAKLSVLEQEML